MTETPTSSVEQLYGEIWNEPDFEFYASLTHSLNPGNPSRLYDLFGELGVGPGAKVLDVGCRTGDHAVQLVRKFNCRVIALDPLALHLEKARTLVSRVGLAELIEIRQGSIELLPLSDSSLDYIWCRDMLAHVDLYSGLAECARVLRPGGAILIFHVFATDLCEPVEAAMIFKALSFVPQSMSEKRFAEVAQQVGLDIIKKEPLRSEWREAEIEMGDRTLLDQLLFVARMRRNREALVTQHGAVRYEVNYASFLLGIYQMLGKLCPAVYILGKP
jgi:ubiquinone/menaquinone biosynthesis C-methylase UbiE